jgi:AAA domain
MIALWVIKTLIEAGERVVVFDAENGTRTITERLERMGVRPEAVDLIFYLPFPTLTRDANGQRDFEDLLDRLKPELLVFDAWASFLSSAGLSENENSDVEDWDSAFTKVAKKRAVASLVLDHTPHDGIRSRGAARKREVADIQWRVKKTLEFNRDTVGEAVLIIEKDREGWLPGSVTFSVGGSDGKLICRPTGGTVEEPSREDGLKSSARKTLDTLRSEFGASGATATEWQKAVGRAMSEATFYRSRDTLIKRRLVVKEQRRYYPAPEPSAVERESSETRVSTPETSDSHELSFNSHESNESEDAKNSHYSHPPVGVSNESEPESATPPRSNTAALVAAVFEEGRGGPSKNLPLYRAGQTTLTILTNSVLDVLGVMWADLDPDDRAEWERVVASVAAEDG